MDEKSIRYSSPLTEYLYARASGSRIPLSGTFELSPLCNFACRMCYVRKTRAEVAAHPRPMLTKEQWLEIARQARDAGMLYLLLTGGEPFLWPDFWELYEELCSMGFLISINTNGSLIDDAAIARLKKNPPQRINITLYGAGDDTYEALCGAKGVFARVDRAICGLQKAGIQLKLNCSLTPQNAKDQEAVIRYAQGRGLMLSMTEYMFPPLRRDPDSIGRNERFTPAQAAHFRLERNRMMMSPQAYRMHLEKTVQGISEPLGLDESCVDPLDGKIRCRAGKTAFWITWDGFMTPCGMLPEPKADVTDRSFLEAWQDTLTSAASMTLSGICAKCRNQSVCHACVAMSAAETGTFSGIPHYLCEMVEELKKQAAAALAKLPAESM